MNSMTVTGTSTYTKTDIRHVWECFEADIFMLARRTQALDINIAINTCNDIFHMACEKCISEVHVQLYDRLGRRVRAHRYRIQNNVNWNTQRPSDNKWPCLPDGQLHIVVKLSNNNAWDQLKNSGKLKVNWGDSGLDTQYTEMRNIGDRKYASSSYGWQRSSYSVY